jgi:hypothetical protein
MYNLKIIYILLSKIRGLTMGSASMKHPITGALYTDVEGNVKVELDGSFGIFRENGEWISGAMKSADPMLCKWVAGHKFGDEVPFRNQRLQVNSGMGHQKSTDKN